MMVNVKYCDANDFIQFIHHFFLHVFAKLSSWKHFAHLSRIRRDYAENANFCGKLSRYNDKHLNLFFGSFRPVKWF